MKTPKRVVQFDGTLYRVRSNTVAIPDLTQMERLAALLWLNTNTYARGYSRQSNPLQGYGGSITTA